MIHEWHWYAIAKALMLSILLLEPSINVGVLSAPEKGRQTAVEVGDNYYRPEGIRVQTGDVIVFTNNGKQLHSLTLIDHESLLDEAYLDPGKTFSFTVPNSLPPGEYVLACNIHVDMQGRMIIGP
jgi:plastocyanin